MIDFQLNRYQDQSYCESSTYIGGQYLLKFHMLDRMNTANKSIFALGMMRHDLYF